MCPRWTACAFELRADKLLLSFAIWMKVNLTARAYVCWTRRGILLFFHIVGFIVASLEVVLSLLKSLKAYLVTLDIIWQTRLHKSIFVDWVVVDGVLAEDKVWLSTSNYFNYLVSLLQLLYFVVWAFTLFVSIVTSSIECVAISKRKIALFQSFGKLGS